MKPKAIYTKCLEKNFLPQHVAEVGVYLPETSNILDFIKKNIRTTLVEADPQTVKAIENYFDSQYPITIFPVAIFDKNGTIELSKKGSSTFISELKASPALINDQYQIQENDKFTVEAKRFDEIDDGTIDLLSVDIEGADWYVIKYMKSRPAVISIETHGKYYTNPFQKEILGWMQANDYQIWFKDASDSVFVKNGTFSITFLEKVQLAWVNFVNGLKRLKGRLKGRKLT